MTRKTKDCDFLEDCEDEMYVIGYRKAAHPGGTSDLKGMYGFEIGAGDRLCSNNSSNKIRKKPLSNDEIVCRSVLEYLKELCEKCRKLRF